MRLDTILVTGASGFIGRHLVNRISDQLPGSTIVGVGRSPRSESFDGSDNTEYISADLLDDGANGKLPGRIDAVVHLAGDRRGFVSPDQYSQQIHSNVGLVSKMADYAINAGAECFLLASSVYVYSGTTGLPFKEDSPVRPKENLGASKVAAEAIVEARSCAGHFRGTAFRIFTTYGPGSSASQFIPVALRKLTSPEPEARFGNPDVKRDFVFVTDVAEALTAGLTHDGVGPFRIYNVGSGEARRIRDVVQLIARIVETSKPIEFDGPETLSQSGDGDHHADVSLIRSELGWSPNIPLGEGLRTTIDSAKQSAQENF